MLKYLLGDLAANAMPGPTIVTLKTILSIQSNGMMVSPPLLTLVLSDICVFCKLLSLWYSELFFFSKSKSHDCKKLRFYFHCEVGIVKLYAI